MKCIICNGKFISTKFLIYDIDLPTCDTCLLDILKARKDIKMYEIDRLDYHIEDLKKRIKEGRGK